MEITSFTLAIIACLPSAITGLCFWMIENKIQKESRNREEREKLREQQQLFLVKGVNAAITLGEATAKAMQRIPDAKCNGDMHAALEYAEKIKHEQRDFLEKQGIHKIYD